MKHILAFSTALVLLAVSAHATPINLGTAGSFGLLAGSGITNAVSGTVITGDVGSSPTSAVTGLTSGMVNGNLYTTADPATSQAQSDLTVAYNTAAGATPTVTLTGTDLGFYNAANPLSPGVYFYSSSAALTGNLTLDGGGDPNAQWIFQVGSTLTTAADSTIALINGATNNAVFWQVGSSATIGANNAFAGNIMALQNITLNGGTLDGRALARNGAITMSSAETVNNGGASPVPEPSGIMALGMMIIPAVAFFRRKK